VDYSQGQRDDSSHMNNGQREGGSSGSGKSFERTRQLTPRSELRERNDTGDNFDPPIIPNSEVVTSGQVCR
jgi:hypothetical protein